jgi:hypothetical protein
MHDDPVRYWQELTDNYRQMSDGELLVLAENLGDLTQTAQQVLRDEMTRRGLGKPEAVNEEGRKPVPVRLDRPATLNWEPARYRNSPREEEEEPDLPHEYTWKTFLCECNTREEALDIGLVLKQAGIDSWISRPDLSLSLGGPRIQVAADQLEQAQTVLAHYVPPKQVKDEEEVPEFVLPVCPTCGSKDGAMLESADPVNAWLCEACGAQWTDPDESGGESEKL